jgi:hypothetical protein
MVASNPVYRNNRKNFYSEKGPDTVSVGTIVNVFKTKSNKKSLDSEFVPISNPINGTSSYVIEAGNAEPENNPDFQYRGYLYCDGSEYNIKDYPLLYASIGNSYGGVASNGITVLNRGSGYSGATTVIFSAAPAGGVRAEGIAVVDSGLITSITVTKPGANYITPPTITLSNTGGGVNAQFSVRINSNGSVSPITQQNVFEFWPEENMGTFKVPDLLAKKIVGYGAVYGSGTPVIGNIDLTIGIDSIGGKWYLDENSQKGQFNLGQIVTTGYTNVTDTIGGAIIGSQTIRLTLQEKRLSGAPQHSHLLLHSEAPNVQGGKPGITYDSYLTGYKNGTGKIEGFLPSGGIALAHSHALLKKASTSTTFSTYDLFNYTGGDAALGTSNPTGNIYASGGSGTFELVTYTPNPTFLVFNDSSQIGGRTILTSGTPIYQYTTTNYDVPGTYSYSVNTAVDELIITVTGGGASGAVYDQSGNDGSASSVTLGSNSLILTAGGGNRGGAASSTVGGTGGFAGTTSISGPLSGSFGITQNLSGNVTGYSGGDGQGGPFWKAVNATENPYGTWGGSQSATGSAGKYLSISNVVEQAEVTIAYPSTGNFTVAASNGNYSITNVTIELYGAGGANCGNFGGLYGCTTGTGGSGKYFKLSLRDPENSSGSVFGFYPGQGGLAYAGSASATYGTASGGSGGDGNGTNDGGGGGAATILTGAIGASTQIVAGAGAGGGGGGAGEGQCGDNSIGNTINDGVQATTSPLFSGAGGSGGRFGCTGGGGGGGGGGVGLADQTGNAQGSTEGGGTASAGGPGGGGGGTGGHGGGYGGTRGLSSYRSDLFDLVSSGTSSEYNGKLVGKVTEDRSNWTSGGGGGGSGGRISGNLTGSTLAAAGVASATIVVGNGGSGVSRQISGSNNVSSSSGSNGSVRMQAAIITGYQGGTTSVSIGDIIESASQGPAILSSGSGTGSAGGFKLPTTQVPSVIISPQGDQPGGGATATVSVSNGAITGINLGSGGSGYESAPNVRFLGGAGAGTTATTTKNAAGNVTGITLGPGTGTAYTKYVRIGGTELQRYIVLLPFDCTNVEKIGVKAARGNDINGGERADDSADELRVYYNTDGSDNFPDSQFIGVIVPRPTDNDIATNYDGTSGDTKWHTYTINIPQAAQTTGVKFKIWQRRTAASGANDNGGNVDNYGIAEFFYDYKIISETQFVPSPGELSANAASVLYTIEGPANSAYPAGIAVNDITFNMTAGVPLLPTPFLDPVQDIQLLEPYALTKHLIKAY